MNILWMTWKDMMHPLAGGAEFINEEIAKRLARDGHEVSILTSAFPGCNASEVRDGYRIIRMGNRYTVYWKAYRYYKSNLVGWADLVIDEMNTIPFFCKFYVREKNILLAYQLCREIWLYQMFFPLNVIGYLLEPIYLWLLCDQEVLTESNSAKKDMMKYGFRDENISVFPVGIRSVPLAYFDRTIKHTRPTVLSLGAIRSMKRTLDQIKAFELAKEKIPELSLKIAGGISDSYGQKVLRYISKSKYRNDIEYLGRVDERVKNDLMRSCHFILVTSAKEGWGLIVTEANAQGTPAIVYNVDGLRDSVRDGETGLLTIKNSPESLANSIIYGFELGPNHYEAMCCAALGWSKELNLESCYSHFSECIER